jgi:hypothetical protein
MADNDAAMKCASELLTKCGYRKTISAVQFAAIIRRHFPYDPAAVAELVAKDALTKESTNG